MHSKRSNLIRASTCAPAAGPIAALACVVLAGIVISYAGLIGMGQWQGDEYLQFAFYRQFGFHEYIARVLGWSPRPVSELLLWLYAAAVERDHRPHIIPFLSLLWAAVVLATIVTIRPSCYRGVLRYRLLMSLALLAMFLVGHPISELFSCLAASYATLAAADYQFGLLCCERHASLRQCFYALAVAALGVWSANGRRRVPGSIARWRWSLLR